MVCSSSMLGKIRYQLTFLTLAVGDIFSSANITSEAFLSTATPTNSGVYGGALLTVGGHGFSRNMSEIQITVGSNPCPVTQAQDDQIQCVIPPQGNDSDTVAINVRSHQIPFLASPALIMHYNETITPSISSISPILGNTSQVLSITGDHFDGLGQITIKVGNTQCALRNRSATLVTCTVSANLSAGNHPVTVHVMGIGDSNSNISYTHDLVIISVTPSQGGYGGGLPVIIVGDGFNGTNVSASVCGQPCLSTSIVSNAQLICTTPNISLATGNSSCNLTVTTDGISKNTPFSYSINLTSTVVSVSPGRGGTGGGTTITINGTNFPWVFQLKRHFESSFVLTRNSINDLTVTIAGSVCSVQTVTQTSITCETGSYQRRAVRAPVLVFINGSGYTVGSVNFQYIDLWSSPWTWGGAQPPIAGDLVVVENSVTVYLDIETPILKVLVIDNATLVFDDSQDVSLNVEYILIVNGGRLQVGTEAEPFAHRGVITMYGNLRSIELPICKWRKSDFLAFNLLLISRCQSLGYTWRNIGYARNACYSYLGATRGYSSECLIDNHSSSIGWLACR